MSRGKHSTYTGKKRGFHPKARGKGKEKQFLSITYNSVLKEGNMISHPATPVTPRLLNQEKLKIFERSPSVSSNVSIGSNSLIAAGSPVHTKTYPVGHRNLPGEYIPAHESALNKAGKPHIVSKNGSCHTPSFGNSIPSSVPTVPSIPHDPSSAPHLKQVFDEEFLTDPSLFSKVELEEMRTTCEQLRSKIDIMETRWSRAIEWRTSLSVLELRAEDREKEMFNEKLDLETRLATQTSLNQNLRSQLAETQMQLQLERTMRTVAESQLHEILMKKSKKKNSPQQKLGTQLKQKSGRRATSMESNSAASVASVVSFQRLIEGGRGRADGLNRVIDAFSTETSAENSARQIISLANPQDPQADVTEEIKESLHCKGEEKTEEMKPNTEGEEREEREEEREERLEREEEVDDFVTCPPTCRREVTRDNLMLFTPNFAAVDETGHLYFSPRNVDDLTRTLRKEKIVKNFSLVSSSENSDSETEKLVLCEPESVCEPERICEPISSSPISLASKLIEAEDPPGQDNSICLKSFLLEDAKTIDNMISRNLQ